MPTIIVTPVRWSRSPIQTFFLGLIAVTGILIAANVSRNAITQEMGEPWASIWGIFLFTGSTVSLLGAYWKDRVTGMLIERSGIFLLGLASLTWPFGILLRVGIDGLFSAVITLAFSISCFVQVAYINKHMNLILDALKDGGIVSDG